MRILLIEDDVSLCKALLIHLGSQGYETDVCHNGTDGLSYALQNTYDLIILDRMLPELDGMTLLGAIRKKNISTPVIMATAMDSLRDKISGLDCGADDYITKPFGIMELISRVKALLRRSAYVEEKKFLTLGNVFMDDEKHAVYVSDQVCELTYKEYELLKLLMSNAGIVTARDTIMERIWGIDFEGESRTLDMHIKTLRKKLGEAGSMIKTVRNVGYIMSDKEN